MNQPMEDTRREIVEGLEKQIDFYTKTRRRLLKAQTEEQFMGALSTFQNKMADDQLQGELEATRAIHDN